MEKSEQYTYLLDTRLNKVFDKTWKETVSRLALLYEVVKSTLAIEYDYAIGDIGSPSKFDGQIDYQQMYGQYRTSYEHDELVTGLRIQRKLLDDDQYSVINKMPMALSRSMKLQREEDAANPFINAFNTAYQGSDGVSLCNSSHPKKGTTTQQSNTGTADFTHANLKSERISMIKTKTDKSKFVGSYPSMIIVPIDMGDDAAEITKSTKVPYEISNTYNVNDGTWKVVDWLYLTDTSNWFIVDVTLMKMYLRWFNRIDTEFNRDADTDTYVKKYSSYMRYKAGFSGWEWIRGQNVS